MTGIALAVGDKVRVDPTLVPKWAKQCLGRQLFYCDCVVTARTEARVQVKTVGHAYVATGWFDNEAVTKID